MVNNLFSIDSGIHPAHLDWFEKMNKEQQKSRLAPTQGKYERRRRMEAERRQTAKTKPLLNMTKRQRILLANTMPLSREVYS